jgi:hypothetical protein
MKTLSNYPAKIYIGTANNEKIYLSAPSWDCGWYWGFGYLGNNNCHYHVDGLSKDKNLFDSFKEHFSQHLIVRDSQLWTLCELFKTFYSLKEAAEILGRGGAHYTTNPCKDVIINTEEVNRINSTVLPAIFEEIYKILIPSQDNEKADKKIVKLILAGDTKKVVDFMLENKISTDDLKNVHEVTKHDFNVVHSYYWEQFHKNKKASA